MCNLILNLCFFGLINVISPLFFILSKHGFTFLYKKQLILTAYVISPLTLHSSVSSTLTKLLISSSKTFAHIAF